MRTITFSAALFAFFLLCAIVLCHQQQAWAHGIRCFAYTSGPDIVVEGKFSNNRATQNSDVKVYNLKTGKLLVEGTTNKEGMYTFPRPALKPDEGLKIVLRAGEGHQAQWTMTPEDLNEEPLPEEPVAETSSAPAESEENQATASSEAASASQATGAPCKIDTRELADLVTRRVAREIAPLKRMMMEQINHGPTIRDIIGGLGWIIGIGGLLFALKKK